MKDRYIHIYITRFWSVDKKGASEQYQCDMPYLRTQVYIYSLSNVAPIKDQRAFQGKVFTVWCCLTQEMTSEAHRVIQERRAEYCCDWENTREGKDYR